MKRRQYLSRAGAAIAISASIAGCSGGGGGNETNANETDQPTNGETASGETTNGETGDSGVPSLTTSGPADGEVASNAIGELAVVKLESQASTVFSVTVTLQNTGDQRTNAINYTYKLALFDSDGNELGTVVASVASLGSKIAPGKQGSVIATAQYYDGKPGDVARYELTIDCSKVEGEDRGVYCS